MAARTLLFLALSAALSAGCELSTTPQVDSLSAGQARAAMGDVGVSIPSGYTLVGMAKTSPAGPGSPGYAGAFEKQPGQGDAEPLLVEGNPPPMTPVACVNIRPTLAETWKPYGFACPLADVRFLETNPVNRATFTLDLLTGTQLNGTRRLYVYSTGT